MSKKIKKYALLGVLFFMPIMALLFFVKAQYNFKPVDYLEVNFKELPKNSNTFQFKDKITIVAFLGKDISANKNVFFNLNQKINKRFGVYKHLRLLVVALNESKKDIDVVLDELKQTSEIDKWNIAYLDEVTYKDYYNQLGVQNPLSSKLSANKVFLVDEKLQVRGRKDDKEYGYMLGFDPNDVAQVNRLKDDVKMLLKEYSVHYNENKANRKKSNINLKNEE